jgi:hypothetical protein
MISRRTLLSWAAALPALAIPNPKKSLCLILGHQRVGMFEGRPTRCWDWIDMAKPKPVCFRCGTHLPLTEKEKIAQSFIMGAHEKEFIDKELNVISDAF